MFFLDIPAVVSSDKDWVIYLLLGLIAILFMAGVGLFTWGVNAFTKRMDRQESLLQTWVPKFTEHDIEIRNLKGEVQDLKQWQGIHDTEIQSIKRHPALRS